MESPILKDYNVIIFGESGVGKSSVVNLIFNKKIAKISNSAIGCTFETTLYKGVNDNVNYNIYDTAGLSESEVGTVKPDEAVGNLIKLIRSLDKGVHLLIMVMKQGRINNTIYNNYKIFYEGIFDCKIPLLLVVTHCELDDPLDKWWLENKGLIKNRFKLKIADCLCITTLNEGKYASTFKNEYKKSGTKLITSIVTHSLNKPFIIGSFIDFFTIILKRIWNVLATVFNWKKLPLNEIFFKLFSLLGIGDKDATDKTNKLVDELKNNKDNEISVVNINELD